MSQTRMPRIAVLIPCYNEAVAILAVERDFATALPHTRIYVDTSEVDCL